MPEPIVRAEQADAPPEQAVIEAQGIYIPRRVANIPGLVKSYPGSGFTDAKMRGMVFKSTWSEQEPWASLRDCIIRIGRSVLVDVEKFDRWLMQWRGYIDKSTLGKRGGRPPKKVKRKRARR